MKKLLMIIGIIVGVLFSCNVNASAVLEGAIIKTAYNPDVYIVKYKNGKQFKRLVLNPEVFESYGHLKWGNIQLVSSSVMNSYTTSNLVRVIGQSDVYRLIPNGDTGSKHYLVSTINHDLSSVYTINLVDFGNYITGNVVSSFFCNGMYYSNCEDGQEIVCPSVGKAYCRLDKQQQAIRDAEIKRQQAIEEIKRQQVIEKIERITKATEAAKQLLVVANEAKVELDILNINIQTKKEAIKTKTEIEAEVSAKLAGTGAVSSYYYMLLSSELKKNALLVVEYNSLVNQYNIKLENYKKILSMTYVIEDYSKNVYIFVEDRAFLGLLGIHLD